MARTAANRDERITALAALWRRSYRPYSYGPFEIPSQAAIAAADAEHLLYEGCVKGTTWAAISRSRRSHLPIEDFAQRAVTLPLNAFVTTELAYEGRAADALSGVLSAHPGSFLFIHEEDKELKAAVSAAGGRYVLSKVGSFSRLEALYSFAPKYTPAHKADRVDLLTLSTLMRNFISERERKALLAELEAFGIEWADHYSSYNKNSTWSAFALRGYVHDDPSFIIKPSEMGKTWQKEHPKLMDSHVAYSADTVAAPHFPMAMKVAARIPGAKDRIRLMKLTPGGELTRHTDISDRDAGTLDNQVVRLHIPLVTSRLARFHALGARARHVAMHFDERNLYYLDQRKPHWATNADKTTERIHLVIDVASSEDLRVLIRASKEGK